MLLTLLKWLLIALVGLALLLLAAGWLGLLAGRPPADLGVRAGRLKPPSTTPNSVTSQAALYPDHPRRQAAAIAPLAWRGDGASAIAKLAKVIGSMPGAEIVEQRPDYLRARFTSRWLRFVDDAEFWFDPANGVVQVRSASRLGRRDFDVNRQRIERIRALLALAAAGR